MSLYDVIAEGTNATWAAEALTLFADDTHLAWGIRDARDLQFFLHCIRTTFQVFREFGMTITPDKSQLVVRLRGSAATRWLRSHKCRDKHGYRHVGYRYPAPTPQNPYCPQHDIPWCSGLVWVFRASHVLAQTAGCPRQQASAGPCAS